MLDLIVGLLGGLAADLGSAPEPSPLGQLAADMELDRRLAQLQLLDVGVDGDELDLRDPGLDHPVDGVSPPPPTPTTRMTARYADESGRGVRWRRGLGSAIAVTGGSSQLWCVSRARAQPGAP